MAALFQDMLSKWPSTWIARTEIERFSGGMISEKYLANLDSAGKGPLRAESCLPGCGVGCMA
jgi:hypothetical protein